MLTLESPTTSSSTRLSSVEFVTKVYSMTNGPDLILHKKIPPESQLGTITLKTGPKTYVKFRDIHLRMDIRQEGEKDRWIPIGNPIQFYINKIDYTDQLLFHADRKNKELFGSLKAIREASARFLKNTSLPILERASLSCAFNEKKLTTAINENGELMPILISGVLSIGSYCRVKKTDVRSVDSIASVALAKLYCEGDKSNPMEVEKLQKAISWSAQLRSSPLDIENIVPMVGVCGQNRKKIRIFMPFAPEGDLDQYLKQMAIRDRPEFQKRVGFAVQLAKALSIMHTNGLCHYDVKLNNCLVFGDKLTLCDFVSLSRAGEIKEVFETTFPPPEYRSENTIVDPSVDVWGFGLVLYKLMYTSRANALNIEGKLYYSSPLLISNEVVRQMCEQLDQNITINRVILRAFALRASRITMNEAFEELLKFYNSTLCLDPESFKELIKKIGEPSFK